MGVTVQIAAREEASVGYEWLRRPRRWLIVLDGVAAGCAMLAMPLVSRWHPPASVGALGAAAVTVAFALLLTFILSFRNGQYTSTRRLSAFVDVGGLMTHLVVAISVTALIAFITKNFFFESENPSRLAVGLSLGLFLVLGTASRAVLAYRQRSFFLRGTVFRKVLVLGTGPAAQEFMEFVARRPWLGVACVGRMGYVSPEGTGGDCKADNKHSSLSATIQGLEELDRSWCASGASEVVVALDPHEYASLPEVTRLLSLAHVPFRIVPTLFEATYIQASLLGYGELPVIDVDVDPLSIAQRTCKRALDVCASSLLLVACAVVGLPLLAAIKLDSPGPIFYMQERVGKNGRHFLMYKFRTMVADAEARLEELREHDEGDGPHFKMRCDPRITRVGRFLREWSLDELPQIINVFKGEMSLVGPRPPLPREVDDYKPEYYCRLRGLPGMTGLWQVSGRKDLSFRQMVKLDKYYLDNWSLRLDVSIILKTIYVVLARKGAY